MRKCTLLVLLMLTAALLFAGCNTSEKDNDSKVEIPKTGIELDRLADLKLRELDSYTEIETVISNLTVNDVVFDIASVSTTSVYGKNGNDYVDITEMSIETQYKDQRGRLQIETDDATYGYQDGVMFIKKYLNDRVLLKSKISAVDYQQFSFEREKNMLAALGDSTPGSSTVERTEEGWVATLSDFNADFVEHYLRRMIGGELEFDTFAEDMTVTIITDESYVYKSLTLDFELVTPENAKNTINSLTMYAEFSDINSAKAQRHNIDNCTEVDDLRDYYLVSDAVDNMRLADYGHCDLTYELNILTRDDGKTTQVYECDFSRDEKLEVSLSITQDEQKLTQTYADGKITSKLYKSDRLTTENTTTSDDVTQLSSVFSIFDYISFDMSICKSAPKKVEGEENTYVIEITPTDDLENLVGGHINSCTLTLIIENGNVTRYHTFIDAYYSKTKYIVETDATFVWSKQ